MNFSCTCEVKGIENCSTCPVTLNKESVFRYIQSRNETQDHENFIKHLMGSTNISGHTSSDGRDELEKALESLKESLSSLSFPPSPLFSPGYTGGIIHTGKLFTNTDDDEPEENVETAEYNVYYNGHKVGSVNCYEHVEGPKEHWFLDTGGAINTKMSLGCKIVKQ